MELDAAQMEGANFLAQRRAALLADEPGFGKTAQAITACDLVNAKNILVVTTASARLNWLNEFRLWSRRKDRSMSAWLTIKPEAGTDVVVVAWSNVINKNIQFVLAAREWDAIILDESHYAKNPTTKRTQAVYNTLAPKAARVWCLSGTPAPNAPDDLFPMLKALAPHTIAEYPDLFAFQRRFCVMLRRNINGYPRDIVIGGKNEDDLRCRIANMTLRRKLPLDVGIRYSAVHVAGSVSDGDIDQAEIIAAAESGDTRTLDMHLGVLRRLTGKVKAKGAAEMVSEALDGGQDKIVVFAWHHDVIDYLDELLWQYKPVGIDGRTPAGKRQEAVEAFQNDPERRVFIAQIQAAGEAITLTAANRAVFVEQSFVPKDMAQAVRRIYRRGQTRPCLCQVATLPGSIDEALTAVVLRKMQSIRKIVEPNDAD